MYNLFKKKWFKFTYRDWLGYFQRNDKRRLVIDFSEEPELKFKAKDLIFPSIMAFQKGEHSEGYRFTDMAKKFGGLVVFGLAAGAAAAGVYHYLQSKDKDLTDIDDFDDLDNFEESDTKRSYVNLDNAKSFMSGAFDKAKDVADKAGKKIGEFVDEFKKESEEDDGDVVEVVKDAAEDVADTAEDVAEKVSDAVSEVAETVGDETEDFFNDDDET